MTPDLGQASVADNHNRNGGDSPCEICGVSLLKGAWGILPRNGRRYCSNACRQAAYRQRKHETSKPAPAEAPGGSAPDPPGNGAGARFVFFPTLVIQAARPGEWGPDRYVYSLAGPEGWTTPRLARVLKAMQAAAREPLDGDDGGELA